MKKPILDIIIERKKGFYTHCVEVFEVYELEVVAEFIYDEFIESHGKVGVIEFLESLSVYSLSDENEEEIYNFSFADYINSL